MKNTFLNIKEFQNKYKYAFNILSLAGYDKPKLPKWDFKYAETVEDKCTAYFSPTIYNDIKDDELKVICTVDKSDIPTYQTIYKFCNSQQNTE